MVQPEVTVDRVASGPLASGKSLGVTGATVSGSKTSVRSSDLPLWQVTVASHTADCYPQPRFIEPCPPVWRRKWRVQADTVCRRPWRPKKLLFSLPRAIPSGDKR